MSTLGEITLLGTSLRLDMATLGIVALVLALCAVLGIACAPSLRASLAARIAFAFVVLGALIQALAGELLLFLTGGAVIGYAMLALGLAGPRALTRFHALAAAILIVAGDLALLELVMILAKSATDLTYAGAGSVFSTATEGVLAGFCLVLGFGGRLALLALCIPEGRSSAANIATLPGWLLLGVSSSAGAIRLSCAGAFGAACAAPLVDVLWWVPLLAIIAWQLPGLIPPMLRAFVAAGARVALIRDASQRGAERAARSIGAHVTRVMGRAERGLTLWPMAMTGMLLLLIACAVLLFTNPARATDPASPAESVEAYPDPQKL